MSTLSSASPYSFSARIESTGSSQTAARLAGKFTDPDSNTPPSLRQLSVFDALAEVYEECRVPSWNGGFAKPVLPQTFHNARKFLSTLPSSFPVPDVMAEPDGEIAFEWRAANRSVLSVSIGAGDTITFAGLFGYSGKQHGTELFYDTIPQTILSAIRRVFQHSAGRAD